MTDSLSPEAIRQAFGRTTGGGSGSSGGGSATGATAPAIARRQREAEQEAAEAEAEVDAAAKEAAAELEEGARRVAGDDGGAISKEAQQAAAELEEGARRVAGGEEGPSQEAQQAAAELEAGARRTQGRAESDSEDAADPPPTVEEVRGSEPADESGRAGSGDGGGSGGAGQPDPADDLPEGQLQGSDDPRFQEDLFQDPAQQEQFTRRLEQQAREQFDDPGLDIGLGDVRFQEVDDGRVRATVSPDAFLDTGLEQPEPERVSLDPSGGRPTRFEDRDVPPGTLGRVESQVERQFPEAQSVSIGVTDEGVVEATVTAGTGEVVRQTFRFNRGQVDVVEADVEGFDFGRQLSEAEEQVRRDFPEAEAVSIERDEGTGEFVAEVTLPSGEVQRQRVDFGRDPSTAEVTAQERVFPGAGEVDIGEDPVEAPGVEADQGARRQGLEETGPTDEITIEGEDGPRTATIREVAQDLEQEALEDLPGLGPEDVRVVREDGTFQAELTPAGRAEAARQNVAEQFGIDPEAVGAEVDPSGRVTIAPTEEGVTEFETGRQLTAAEEFIREEFPEAQDISIEGVGDDQFKAAVTTAAGEEVERTLAFSENVVDAADRDGDVVESLERDLERRVALTRAGITTSAGAGGLDFEQLPDVDLERGEDFEVDQEEGQVTAELTSEFEEQLREERLSAARKRIEGQLEREADVDLGAEDVEFEREDGQIVGRLTESGRKKVRVQQTPIVQLSQDSPAEGLIESGRRIGVEIESDAMRRREQVLFDEEFEDILEESGVSDIVQDFRGGVSAASAEVGESIDAAVQRGKGAAAATAVLPLAVADEAGLDTQRLVEDIDIPSPAEEPEAFAAATVPVAAAEPTPAGEIAVGGALAVGAAAIALDEAGDDGDGEADGGEEVADLPTARVPISQEEKAIRRIGPERLGGLGAASALSLSEVREEEVVPDVEAKADVEPPGLFQPEIEQPEEGIGRGMFEPEIVIGPSSLDLPELLPPTDASVSEGAPVLTPPEIEQPEEPIGRGFFPAEQAQPEEPIGRGFFPAEVDVPTAQTAAVLQEVRETRQEVDRERRRQQRRRGGETVIPSEFIPEDPAVIGREIDPRESAPGGGIQVIFRPNPRSMELRQIETEFGTIELGPELTRVLESTELGGADEASVDPIIRQVDAPAPGVSAEGAAVTVERELQRQEQAERIESLADIGQELDPAADTDTLVDAAADVDTAQLTETMQIQQERLDQVAMSESVGDVTGTAEVNVTVTEDLFEEPFEHPTVTDIVNITETFRPGVEFDAEEEADRDRLDPDLFARRTEVLPGDPDALVREMRSGRRERRRSVKVGDRRKPPGDGDLDAVDDVSLTPAEGAGRRRQRQDDLLERLESVSASPAAGGPMATNRPPEASAEQLDVLDEDRPIDSVGAVGSLDVVEQDFEPIEAGLDDLADVASGGDSSAGDLDDILDDL